MFHNYNMVHYIKFNHNKKIIIVYLVTEIHSLANTNFKNKYENTYI